VPTLHQHSRRYANLLLFDCNYDSVLAQRLTHAFVAVAIDAFLKDSLMPLLLSLLMHSQILLALLFIQRMLTLIYLLIFLIFLALEETLPCKWSSYSALITF
jgi:hypothetical protein